MKALVNWNIIHSNVPTFIKGDIVEIELERFEHANRDSPGCMTAIEAEPEAATPEDRMMREGFESRAPESNGVAMHSGNMPGLLTGQADSGPVVMTRENMPGMLADKPSEAPPASPGPAPAEPAEETKPEVPVTDAALALAEENDLDLDLIEGTGKDGKITIGDVRAALE